MQNVFTYRDLLTLELLSEAYSEAVKKYKRAIARSEEHELKKETAKNLGIAYGLCWFADYMKVSSHLIKLDFFGVIRKCLIEMDYNQEDYICYVVADSETQTLAKFCLDHRKKVLKKMIKYVKTRIYEERK
jgi:hypothetical protein